MKKAICIIGSNVYTKTTHYKVLEYTKHWNFAPGYILIGRLVGDLLNVEFYKSQSYCNCHNNKHCSFMFILLWICSNKSHQYKPVGTCPIELLDILQRV